MVALAIETRGHQVNGHDISPNVAGYLNGVPYPFEEEGAADLLRKTKIQMLPLAELCEWAEIIFLAPQTPHQDIYEGHSPLPETRADFDYRHLRTCVQDVDRHLKRPTTCVIISTVLPGTLDREVLPLLGPKFRLVYGPLFIAMGTVVTDYLNPEFVLCGAHDPDAAQYLTAFYATIHRKPLFWTDLRTAEGIKVFYNTFITAKIALANLYGEMAHKLQMNVDDISDALSLATDRLISPRYLRAGMGDGGPCHPRDNIALSFIARKIGLSFDFFTALMEGREKHCEWLADLIEEHRGARPIAILGRAFKPETNISTGSPSRLLSSILHRRQIPHEIGDNIVPTKCGLYFIGTCHARWAKTVFPRGSVVIDPFRCIPDQQDVQVVRIGYGRRAPTREAVEAEQRMERPAEQMAPTSSTTTPACTDDSCIARRTSNRSERGPGQCLVPAGLLIPGVSGESFVTPRLQSCDGSVTERRSRPKAGNLTMTDARSNSGAPRCRRRRRYEDSGPADLLTYCSLNFPEDGKPAWLNVDRQRVNQWPMIAELQGLRHRLVTLGACNEWLFLGDRFLYLQNEDSQAILATAIRKASRVVINDLAHAMEGQHGWLTTGVPAWMPARDYDLVTNSQTRLSAPSNVRVHQYDFLFNRTKAYYSGFPFTGSTWYDAGRENYRAPVVKDNAVDKKKIFISPCRLYLDQNRTFYRKKLFDLTAQFRDRGYRSGPGRIRNGMLDKSGTGSYLLSTTDDPLINFQKVGWCFDPETKHADIDVNRLHAWRGAEWHGYSPVHNHYYDNTFVSVYAETIEHGGFVVVTEKTYEPLIKGHFILPFSNHGFLAAVRNLGFLLPDFIDYSYDDIEDNDVRFERYAAEVSRILTQPLPTWRRHWRSHLKLLQYNQRLFYRREYDPLDILPSVDSRLPRRSAEY
jgi:UDPglucose 6-dehydrogenase